MENCEINANKCIKWVNDRTENDANVHSTEVVVSRSSSKQPNVCKQLYQKGFLKSFPFSKIRNDKLVHRFHFHFAPPKI